MRSRRDERQASTVAVPASRVGGDIRVATPAGNNSAGVPKPAPLRRQQRPRHHGHAQQLAGIALAASTPIRGSMKGEQMKRGYKRVCVMFKNCHAFAKGRAQGRRS